LQKQQFEQLWQQVLQLEQPQQSQHVLQHELVHDELQQLADNTIGVHKTQKIAAHKIWRNEP